MEAPTDAVSDFLGVTALSFDELEGELHRRATVGQRFPFASSSIISQTITGCDSELATQRDDSVVIQAKFQFFVTQDSTVGTVPDYYQEMESDIRASLDETNQETQKTTKTIDTFPGLIASQTKGSLTTEETELDSILLVQAFPWGLVMCEICYDLAHPISEPARRHHEWLQEHKADIGTLHH